MLKGQSGVIAIEQTEGNDHAQLIGEGLQFPFGSWDGKAVSKTSLNPKYLLEALNFFNDYVGEKGVVRLSLTSPLRPMVLTADKATYLITPVRTF